MKLFPLAGSLQPTSNSIFENRLKFEGVKEKESKNPGIRYYNVLTSTILKAFNKNKIIEIEDSNGKVYHINRKSLENWINSNAGEVGVRGDISRCRKSYVRGVLDQILKKKSPENIVQESSKRNDLEYLERLNKRWFLPAKLKQEYKSKIEGLKKEINSLREEKS